MALTVEEKVRIKLDALVESYEKRLWSIYAPSGVPIQTFLMAIALTVFVLFWVGVPYMNLFEEVMDVPAPSKAVLKVFGIGLTGYMILLIVTIVQQKIETANTLVGFNQRFHPGSHERAIALQLLAMKPGRGVKRLFAALGGVPQLIVDGVPTEEGGSGPGTPAFQPIPIQTDPAPTSTSGVASVPGAPPANRGYIPLQPEGPASEKADGERPPQP